MAGRKLEMTRSSIEISYAALLAAVISITGAILALVAFTQEDYSILGVAVVLELMAAVWAILSLRDDR